MSKYFVHVLLALFAVAVIAMQASSQPQGSAKRNCIDAMNKSSARVSNAQGKEIRDCVRDGGLGLLGPLPLSGQLTACLVADSDNKVFKAKQKSQVDEGRKCVDGILPDFGVPQIQGSYDIGTNSYSNVVNPTAVDAQLALVGDVIGSPVDGGLANRTTKPAASLCQRTMLSAAHRCLKIAEKEFNRCKKIGLRDGVITSGATLATQCLMQGGNPAAGQPDPTGRLARTCETKFSRVMTSQCSGVVLADTLAGVCENAANVPQCVRSRVSCRLCQQLNRTDGLSRDCDLFDDATDNDSCPNVLPACGDGQLDIGTEQCDDGNTAAGDCCSPTCTFESTGSFCGSGLDDACTNPDTCNGAGVCQPNDATAGTSCGDATDDACTNPDTCDGFGGCQANDEPSGTTCGDPQDTDCTDPDTCDGSGVCQSHDAMTGTTCGDPSDTDCTNPDTCDGAGTCSPNHAMTGSTCTDDGNPCTADTCDVSGACVHDNLPADTPCGDPSDTDCTNADTCDGAGTCAPNHEPAGTGCTSDGIECTNDICNSTGTCTHPTKPAGSPCGNPADTTCTDPDTCDAGGTCQTNDASSGTACASDGNECTDDLCNGSGTCAHPNKTAGIACTDDGSECTNDQCNGGGSCIHPAKTAGTPCSSDGNGCTDDQCNGAGSCGHINNSAPCSDGLFCNGADTCSGGNCSAHAGNPCPGPDGDSNCHESCNETTDSCTANDTNGSFCNDGQSCNGADSCSSGSCVGSGVCCGSQLFTFTVNSNSGGVFDSAEWPGGTASQNGPAGCSITINRPNENIDLVCTLAAPFSVNSFAGYSNCFGTGGEDGDGCQPVSCPPAGVGSCCSGRPSCSAALNGSGSAKYFVQCVDP